MKNLKKTVTTALLATGLALGGIGMATAASPGSVVGPETAQAAVYGKPGCIGDYKWKYSHTERWTRLRVFVETCDYRTSTGAVINDARTGNTWKTW